VLTQVAAVYTCRLHAGIVPDLARIGAWCVACFVRVYSKMRIFYDSLLMGSCGFAWLCDTHRRAGGVDHVTGPEMFQRHVEGDEMQSERRRVRARLSAEPRVSRVRTCGSSLALRTVDWQYNWNTALGTRSGLQHLTYCIYIISLSRTTTIGPRPLLDINSPKYRSRLTPPRFRQSAPVCQCQRLVKSINAFINKDINYIEIKNKC